MTSVADFWNNIFLPHWWAWGWTVVQSACSWSALLVIIAFLLLMDRKVWAAVQLRRGPNVVGAFGLLQSFADLLKFVLRNRSSRPAPTRSCSCWRRW